MEQKTKIVAEEGKLDMVITREFDLPVELLFKAFEESEFIEQWMGTKVLSLESKKFGRYELQKADPQGNVVFQAAGVIHEFDQNKKITRTFEMANTPFGVQLEFYAFEPLTESTSRLNMHVIYESVGQRDQVIKFGMTQGINWAHNQIQEVMSKLK